MGQRTIEGQAEQFVDQLFEATLGTFTTFGIYLGDELGYYETLAADGPSTPTELAARTGTDERYAREWLEHQTVIDILDVEDETLSASERRYTIPAAHVDALTDEDSLSYMPPLAQVAVGAVLPIHDVVDAFRTGDGIPFADYSPDLHEGQGRMNRASFLQLLGEQWLPSIPDVDERLRTGSPARVADVGCGFGYSCIGIADSYPNAHVDGFDLDEESVEAARENVSAAELDDRVTIHHRDAADPAIDGDYDLVTAFECIHDMSDPVGALATMRRLTGDDGVVIVMDERVQDRFTADGTPVEQLMYGFSILHCLPVGRVDHPSAATGTVMRSGTLRDYAEEAGFSTFEVLPIENFFFRFYRLEV